MIPSPLEQARQLEVEAEVDYRAAREHLEIAARQFRDAENDYLASIRARRLAEERAAEPAPVAPVQLCDDSTYQVTRRKR